MNGRKFISGFCILSGALFCAQPCAIFANPITPVPPKYFVTAVALVGGDIIFDFDTVLPTQAFFGKNVVIPVQVMVTPPPASVSSLDVSIVYQLLDANGMPLTSPQSVPIDFSSGASSPPSSARTPKAARMIAHGGRAFNGSAIIHSSDLQRIAREGKISYVFAARLANGTSGTMFTSDPTLVSPPAGIFSSNPAGLNSLDLSALKSFKTEIISSTCVPVGPGLPPVILPDLSVGDGHTSVSFGPGSVTGAGNLCITQEDLSTSMWPVGPGGTKPVEVFTIELKDGASLSQSAQLVLSYPSDVNGKVLNMGLNPSDLAIYWLGPEGPNVSRSDQSWYVLSRSNIDTTMHTVAGVTSHFSTFALFAAGAADAAASLRPKQRIITPNDDHQNDVVIFPGLSAGDDVHIFDARGHRVRHLTVPSTLSDCSPSFCWDGKDESGKVVESGVYIYQYTYQGERVSGVVAVAK